ncbi:DNA replication and repair protein RecR [Magnetococcus marinus MC-1]|uniref:Recombination protein RecR n=1 Tax=Magnetococcus marinus (strain ATCC BAA-1437 / JCM 17883 / MC-1) TaxID=156889 RepID=RECR_MAGMM|nr:recombination mediator RecR [Magnetococcus marinus]A0L8F5.1 RecName: Full=Recombination protein RecR [Magnetococcus marinus MC-1]ABK44248.1 DNA replication and repair protein RecR [Magnetococcus marinus MC-1]
MSSGLPTLERSIELFSRLPGVGRKSAQRMVYHLLKEGGREATLLGQGLLALSERIHFCEVCHNLAEEGLCAICQDSKRDHGLICVVEEPVDVLAMERAGAYRGLYHVLGGRLSPMDGIGPDALYLDALLERLQQGGVRELIIATNPTVAGEATAHYITQLAQPLTIDISRLAYGMPMGGELEYLDESTLFQALQGRRGVL